MAIFTTVDDTNNFTKNGTSNDDFYYVDNKKVQIIENENCGEDTVCRFGRVKRNPTSKGTVIKIKLKNAA